VAAGITSTILYSLSHLYALSSRLVSSFSHRTVMTLPRKSPTPESSHSRISFSYVLLVVRRVPYSRGAELPRLTRF